MRHLKKFVILALLISFIYSCSRKTPEEQLQDVVKLYQQRQFLEAIIQCQDIIRKNANKPIVWDAKLTLAGFYYDQRDIKKAEKELTDVYTTLKVTDRRGFTAAEGLVRVYEEQKQFDNSLKIIEDALKNFKPQDLPYQDALMSKFRILSAQQKYDKCMEVLLKIFESYTEKDQIYQNSAGYVVDLVQVSEKYQDGLNALDSVLKKIDPKGDFAIGIYFLKAEIYKFMKDYKQADKIYSDFIKSDIENVGNTAAIKMGELIELQEKYQEAIKFYQDYQKTYPDRTFSIWLNVEIYDDYKALKQADKGQKYIDKAISNYGEKIKKTIDPDEACKLSLELGDLYFKIENYDKAIEQFQKTIKDFPDSKYIPMAYGKTGMSYQNKGDLENAKVWLSDTFKKFPQSSVAMDSYYKWLSIVQKEQQAKTQQGLPTTPEQPSKEVKPEEKAPKKEEAKSNKPVEKKTGK